MSSAHATTLTQIRFTDDASICMVWEDGKPLRVPTQHDMDTLPVGDDITGDDLMLLDGWLSGE